MACGPPLGAFSFYTNFCHLVKYSRNMVWNIHKEITYGGKLYMQGRIKRADCGPFNENSKPLVWRKER
jgi:hypothetical protein